MPNRSAKLADILEQMVHYTSVDPQLRPNLRDGLSIEEIESKFRELPFRLPGEIEELYQWHDGVDWMNWEGELFHYHLFLPLDEGLAIRKGWLQYNTADLTVYDPDLLPLFEFEGEYYAAKCGQEKQDNASIWFVHHGSFQVYDSLKTMLLALLECYETGAYHPTLGDGFVDTTVDEQRVAEIKLRYNPVRQELFDQLRARQEFYYHP